MHVSLLTVCIKLECIQHDTDMFMTMCRKGLTAATAAHLLHVLDCWDHTKLSHEQLTVLAGPKLAVLQLDDCLYVVRQSTLQSRLEQISSYNSSPAYIAVSHVNGIPCLTMASERDVKVRHYISAGLYYCSHALVILCYHQQSLLAYMHGCELG